MGLAKLKTERKEAVCAIPTFTTHQKVREFLGAAGFCRIWIPEFSGLARWLYQTLKGEEKVSLEWGPSQEVAYQTVKAKISKVPALKLPDVTREFNLCS